MYKLFIEPLVFKQRKHLPGKIRQRMKRILNDLTQNPYPQKSKEMEIPDLDVPNEIKLRRIKIEDWRVIYALNEKERWVWVWRIHKRPPYDYNDLVEFIQAIQPKEQG